VKKAGSMTSEAWRLERIGKARTALLLVASALAVSCIKPTAEPSTSALGSQESAAKASAPGPSVAKSATLVASGDDGTWLSLVRRRNYLLEFGAYSLELDPLDGGRIVRFSLDGKGVVQTRDQSPDAYGSSFWTSPQSAWIWPPPLELDRGPWNVKPEGTTLVLESAKNRALGISVSQRVTADPAHEAFVIEYELKNHDDSPRRIAPWQNTRCKPGGLTFFPSLGPTYPASAFRLAPLGGVIWFRHDPKAGQQGKLFADGAEGWLAHLDGDLVFVKVFPDVMRAEQAPKEADVELYIDGAGRFVEVEQQGAYAEIAAGATTTWRVRWLLRTLPPGVDREVGNNQLLDFVRSLVAKSGD
jgi:hypothetical protein